MSEVILYGREATYLPTYRRLGLRHRGLSIPGEGREGDSYKIYVEDVGRSPTAMVYHREGMLRYVPQLEEVRRSTIRGPICFKDRPSQSIIPQRGGLS